jgi:hypothetical protein
MSMKFILVSKTHVQLSIHSWVVTLRIKITIIIFSYFQTCVFDGINATWQPSSIYRWHDSFAWCKYLVCCNVHCLILWLPKISVCLSIIFYVLFLQSCFLWCNFCGDEWEVYKIKFFYWWKWNRLSIWVVWL